mmetsp:Transcript_25830/g.4358  ORF Transcript_25830/g.4358 Transcript_25830/m.4358 type:complete len:99 (-) Transcript_25830:46-342(-)
MSPKRLLRHKEAVSDLKEFTNYRVTRVYDDKNPEAMAPESIRKVIFCSGNVYYDLIDKRRKIGANDIAILRVEQLAPFPFDNVIEYIQKYTTAEIVWC